MKERILDYSTGMILEKPEPPGSQWQVQVSKQFGRCLILLLSSLLLEQSSKIPKLPSIPSSTFVELSLFFPNPPPFTIYIPSTSHLSSPSLKKKKKQSKGSNTRESMDVRMLGLESPLFSALAHLVDSSDDAEKSFGAPSRTYVRDARAMASTPADVKELPSAYMFTIDMPGLKTEDMKVQVEEGNVLVISGERKRPEEEKEGVKYLQMERRMGKFMRKFVLPENANLEAISAVCQDGVLVVTVEKLPPPQPKKPKTIEVKVA